MGKVRCPCWELKPPLENIVFPYTRGGSSPPPVKASPWEKYR